MSRVIAISFVIAIPLAVATLAGRTQQPTLIIPKGQRSPLYSVEFSPDGKRALTSGIGSAILWETATGIVLADFSLSDPDVSQAMFTPDGQDVLTGGFKMMALWDAADGRQLWRRNVNPDQIRPVGFSPDGQSFIGTLTNSRVSVFSTRTGEPIRTLIATPSPTQKAMGDRSDVGFGRFAISPDGKRLAFIRWQDFAAEWDLTTGKLVANFPATPHFFSQDNYHFVLYSDIEFSPDSRTVVTACADSSIAIWDAADGRLIHRWKAHQHEVIRAQFSPDGSRILSVGKDSAVRIWNAETGSLITGLSTDPPGPHSTDPPSPHSTDLPTPLSTAIKFTGGCFMPDGRIATVDAGGMVRIWQADGKPLTIIPVAGGRLISAVVSPDQRQIGVTSEDRTVRLFRLPDGKPLAELKSHVSELKGTLITSDARSVRAFTTNRTYTWDIATCRLTGSSPIAGIPPQQSQDPTGERSVTTEYKDDSNGFIRLWNNRTGQCQAVLKGHSDYINSARFSPDGSKLVTASLDNSFRLWDAVKGKPIRILERNRSLPEMAIFSPDGLYIATAADDSVINLWNVATGKLVFSLKTGDSRTYTLAFSPDGSRLLALLYEKAAIWDMKTGAMIRRFDDDRHSIAAFMPDGHSLILDSKQGLGQFDAATGQPIRLFDYKEDDNPHRYDVDIIGEGKRLVFYGEDNPIVFDIATGRRLSTLDMNPIGLAAPVYDAKGRFMITPYYDNTMKVFDLASGRLLFSSVALDSIDYLTYDAGSRYEGTEAGRKLLHYNCGTEVITLDQVKDRLWVPNLQQRLLRGDSIDAPRLSDLNLCGLTPLVTELPGDSNSFRFRIEPRRGGLGTTVLYVNGNETRRYQPADLHRPTAAPARPTAAPAHPTADPAAPAYDLSIPKSTLADLLIPGQDNPVTVKAFTAADDLGSRGATIISTTAAKDSTPPNLYAVMVGVSDYKGTQLDLKFAAKDANDLSHALEAAATRYLGRQHVFMYNLTTDSNHYRQPEKAAICQTLASIGKAATANDILLIFFAGHGVMGGANNKQFYFLTADASVNSAVEDVGISARELTEWIQPAHIKAQKRVLILDACNSGQAINDIVHIGDSGQQYATARNDDDAEQKKSIDKLNERSGLFILAASASNQSAYEMSRYSQGLLTYSLLKAIKEDPTILGKGKYLNLAPWFDHARNTVTQLVKDNGARQEPQIVSTTNFDIGIVDIDVIAAIRLVENPLFTASNFHNRDESVDGDDLGLTDAINQNLDNIAGRGPGPAISYVAATRRPDAWYLSGSYAVSDTALAVTVNILKAKQNFYHFAVKGNRNNIDAIAANLVSAALSWIAANKKPE